MVSFSKKFNSALYIEQKSLLIVALVTIIGWSMTRLIDGLTGGPTLMYAVGNPELRSDGTFQITTLVQNISRKETIREIHVVFQVNYDATTTEFDCDIITEPPNIVPSSTTGEARNITACDISTEQPDKDFRVRYITNNIDSLLPNTAAKLLITTNKIVDNHN